MIDASLRRPAFTTALSPLIERRRALRIAPPAADFVEFQAAHAPVEAETAPAGDWRADMRFFVGCYLAGLAFFFIILS